MIVALIAVTMIILKVLTGCQREEGDEERERESTFESNLCPPL
jgi:hypothetical protein